MTLNQTKHLAVVLPTSHPQSLQKLRDLLRTLFISQNGRLCKSFLLPFDYKFSSCYICFSKEKQKNKGFKARRSQPRIRGREKKTLWHKLTLIFLLFLGKKTENFTHISKVINRPFLTPKRRGRKGTKRCVMRYDKKGS